MADDRISDPAAPDVRCPWCSAPLASGDEVSCPSCGAILTSDTEPQVPGVTAIDAEAIVRGVRATSPPRRSRLLSWISGEVSEDEESAPAPHESLALPPVEVRREILRMELEAEISDLQAEAGSILADDEVEARDAGLLPPLAEEVAVATQAPPEATPVVQPEAAPVVQPEAPPVVRPEGSKPEA
jgi:hypothetical protein